MGQLIDEARSDLAQLGVSEPEIELQAFDTLTSFASGLPDFLCDIYGERHEQIPTSLLAALPPPEEKAHHDTGCLRAAGAIEQAAPDAVLFD